MLHEDIQSSFRRREKVHIVEHRRFESDLRRHFIGEVQFYDKDHLRVKGSLFVFDHGCGEFVKVPPERTRVFSIDNHISITVLPEEFDLASALLQAKRDRSGIHRRKDCRAGYRCLRQARLTPASPSPIRQS